MTKPMAIKTEYLLQPAEVFPVACGRRDRQTDGRTDGPSYRDARMHLKRQKQFVTTEYDQNYL